MIGWECKKAMGGAKPLEWPIHLWFKAVFVKPNSWSQKKKDTTYWHVVKPDLDNIEKLIKDALKNVAWKDDCQVSYVIKTKVYVQNSLELPGLYIEIQDLSGFPQYPIYSQ